MQLKEQKQLKLGKYPYTYVRTTVMKSMLFKKDDYHKMLKMSFNEIAKFLQDTTYKKEINELATEHSGADLLELALNKNLAHSFKKLMRISPDEVDAVIMAYAKRKDIEDLKTIMRGKFTGIDENIIKKSITGAGTLSKDFLYSLLKKDSVEEILKSNRLVNYSIMSKAISEYKEKNDLISIENSMDMSYYNRLLKFTESLPKEGTLFKDFILKEVEILNILTLLRLKKEKISKEEIKNFIFTSNQQAGLLSKLVDIDDIEEIGKVLEKREYKDAVVKGIDDFKVNSSLITMETELYKFLLRKSILLLHQNPLSVDVILGYMLAKDIEIRNLRVIIKGKQLSLDDDFIEKQLVF